MKKLPIGKQDFESLIKSDCIYVDKTELIFKLINEGFYYFLSRPRRFGKSLTVSTIKEIFSGNKEIFKGLWIYDKIEWIKYPIIHIDFSKLSVKELGTANAINNGLDFIAEQNNIKLSASSPSSKINELINCLSKDIPVVILIDEYDKPIIDYIEDIPKAEENREILKNFYSVLKGNDEHIKFLFITGVSKFSKVSIFSDLNHLNDITIDDNYSTLCGYTDSDLNLYFNDYFNALGSKFVNQGIEVKQEIKDWYNGYSWDGKNFVYNPFSILNFLSKQKFEDFWFKTGTPTFLMKLIRTREFHVTNLEGLQVPGNVLEKYDLQNMELVSLLFQTGYLTIKDYDYKKKKYRMAYPNNEVRQSFDAMLLNALTEKLSDQNTPLLNDIASALRICNIKKFIKLLTVLYKNITYPLIDDKENYYHSIFYLVVKLLGFDIETEVLTSDGRIDAVIKTEKNIFVIEFKLGTAQEALDQIRKKQYHLKYEADKKEIVLLGIGFETENKNIGEYLVEIIL